MERNAEQNVQDIMAMGWTESEVRGMDSNERKELSATARRLLKQAPSQEAAQAAMVGR